MDVPVRLMFKEQAVIDWRWSVMLQGRVKMS